ncbi:MAG TPA: lysoplasmalogenase family protein [Roseiflexaceae bacterium]|nr:lysoplasmalogenase family protein [Roseiflexaceae bacterium]
MPARRRAYGLLALAAAALLAGLVFGRGDRRNRIPLPLRMLSSALVWAAALVLWRAAPHGPLRARAGLAAAGMACGFLGDLVMARVIPLPQHVMFGMLAFGAGHVQYMRAASFLIHQGHEGPEALGGSNLRVLRALRGSRPALIASSAVAVAGWRALVYSPSQPAPLGYAALAYALLLSSMAGLGGALAWRDRRYAPLAAGGALFFLSDLILAGELFRGLFFPHIGDAIWLTYLTGQGLIVTTLGTAST